MPNRVIREGILDSERIENLVRKYGFDAENFYRRLMSVADDYGRFDGRISVIMARCYPTLLDYITEQQVEKWLMATIDPDVGLVKMYEVDGRKYIEILDFGQRLRIQKARYPEPKKTDDSQMTVKCQSDVGLNRRESEGNPNTNTNLKRIEKNLSAPQSGSGETTPAKKPKAEKPTNPDHAPMVDWWTRKWKDKYPTGIFTFSGRDAKIISELLVLLKEPAKVKKVLRRYLDCDEPYFAGHSLQGMQGKNLQRFTVPAPGEIDESPEAVDAMFREVGLIK